MRVGQDNVYPQSITFDGALRGGSGSAPAFDLTLFDEAAAGQGSAVSATDEASADPIQAANEALAREFLDWAGKTPEEKLRARILEARGLDEASLEALPPAEREAIEAEIREAVKQVFGVDDAFATAPEAAGRNETPAFG
jgi:hypothetical protein